MNESVGSRQTVVSAEDSALRGPFAALDCGTNTLRLLVASVTAGGNIVEHTRELIFTGLGQGVDATGVFATEAMARGWQAVERYRMIMDRYGCLRGRFVATSASRDAANRQVFFDGVCARLGFPAELISGQVEAELSYRGVLSGADTSGSPVLVMDSGGGSTEFVRGDETGRLEQAVSIDIGSRRLRERILFDDPPGESQIVRARAVVNQALDASGLRLDEVRSFIGVAGTVTTMAALGLGLTKYDRSQVHGSALGPSQVGELAGRLLKLPVAEVAALGPVAPERAKVLCAGAIIVDEVAKRVRIPLQASESDILDGVVLSMAYDKAGHLIG